MFYSPALLQLARRMRLFLPVPPLVAGAVYLLTLYQGATPGVSAALTVTAAGLSAPSGASHPLFACAARLAAATGLFSVPVRLNLFSALCGALCAMLFYHLVSRLVLFSACEDVEPAKPSGEGRKRSSEAAAVAEMPPEFAVYNTRVRRVAVWSGLLAAFLLVVSAPFWSAATRLDRGPFDLLLALVALSLFPTARNAWRTPRLLASAALFTCGLFETPVFLFMLPGYAFLLLKVGLASRQRFAMLGRFALAGVAGLALMLAAYKLNASNTAALTGPELCGAFLRSAPFSLYREAKTFFPAYGWALPLIQVGMASGLLVFGRKALFRQRRIETVIVLVLLTLAVVPGLLHVSLAPYFVFMPIGHLPVFAHAVLALGAAVAVAAAYTVLAVGKRPQAASATRPGEARTLVRSRQLTLVQAFAKVILPLLLLTAFVSPLRSFPLVRAGRGAFADAMARELLAALKGRTCLVTSGMLDDHLRLQALACERPLVLVSLRARDSVREQERLRGVLDASPLFEGQNRQRLQNALSLSPLRLVAEWLNTDTNACSAVLIEATPDLWTACGYRAVPEGVAFGGFRPEQKPDVAALVKENRSFIERVAPLLASEPGGQPRPYDALREALRLRVGFAATELGVLLEELGEPEAAYQAYSDALRIDPQNVSAALNVCALAIAKQLYPETHDQLKKRVKSLFSDRGNSALGLKGILQRYGTIRQPEFYQQQARQWKAAGMHAVATAKLRNALSLADQAGSATLLEKAIYYEQLGDTARAEECYEASLKGEQSKRGALLGLCRLALARSDADKAEKFLGQASVAGAEQADLLSLTIDLALLRQDLPRARVLLAAATKDHPENARYWGQFAEVHMKQGDTVQIEQALLPQMQKALKPYDLYLVQAIRGTLLLKKGPSWVKEARLALLKSLSMNAAQPSVWKSVLTADMVLNHPAFTETDARALLRLDPDHALANYLLGSVLLAKGKLPEAEDFFRRSLAKEPSANVCNDLAETLRLLSRPQEAEPFARRALERDAGLTTAHDTLACILCDLGQLSEAAREAEKAIERDSSRPAYQLTLLRVLLKKGDAEAVLRQVKALEAAKVALPDELRTEIRRLR